MRRPHRPHRWVPKCRAKGSKLNRCRVAPETSPVAGSCASESVTRLASLLLYFDATRAYVEKHGRPVAFYSDKHSIFRIAKPRDGANRETQFARAMSELNIDVLCANSPQAKGRVERAHQTPQDRLVKELRLRGISTVEAASAFLPAFAADYDARFARQPANPNDAHRPLRREQDLDEIFRWKEQRKLTRNLTLH